MRPNSVLMPVATTTARPRPRATSVPAYAMFCRSPSGTSAASRRLDTLAAAPDSPVRAASSIARFTASVTRTSAGTRSPARSMTTSPGTSSRAGRADLDAVADDVPHRCGHLAQRFERALRAELLHEAEQHGEQHDDGDDHRLERVAEDAREHGGHEEDDDEDVLELRGEGVPRRAAGDGLQLVGAVGREPATGLLRGEPGLGRRQLGHYVVDGPVVPHARLPVGPCVRRRRPRER